MSDDYVRGVAMGVWLLATVLGIARAYGRRRP